MEVFVYNHVFSDLFARLGRETIMESRRTVLYKAKSIGFQYRILFIDSVQ